MHTPSRYIPALRYRWLTPLFDPFIRSFMHEDRFKSHLIDMMQLKPGMRLLDVGCGTGTLAIMIKHAFPQAQVTGLDGDPEILEIANKKTHDRSLEIKYDLGVAYALPYREDYFDRVVSSMVMHHLTRENKIQTFKEIGWVLKSGGEFHLVDFGPPRSMYTRLVSMVMQRLEEVEDNINGNLPTFIQSAGFSSVIETGNSDSVAGILTFYRAVK